MSYSVVKPFSGGQAKTEFDISRERSEALYRSGRDAAEKFFARWNFAAYVQKYRKGQPEVHRSAKLWSMPGGKP